MRTILDKIEGDQIIYDHIIFHGTIVGITTVAKDGFLELHGTVVGDLVLLESSKVNLHGTVNGNVINNGGFLEVTGTINGNLIKEHGDTHIDPKAAINGQIF